ncbi:PACE efflux transporter [Pararhodobacter sp.]|uniref:PACE efflux transporter n=1 Tax=Pararhodobacter sp. TaxID=2127056 RepID=UPI002AFFD36E|nr:PACE efflux transporter [Pararhodobacter sp.]
MRTTPDRIRHAVSFEIIGLALVTPLGALVFDKPVNAIGVIALVGASLATLWNYLYNLGFDHLMQRALGHTRKTVALRVLHALLFEAGLLLVLLPFIAWYLDLTLWQALAMDISFAAFYLVYAFVFNWTYDLIFPIPRTTAPSR